MSRQTVDEAAAIAILAADPDERLIRTNTVDGVEWHFLRDRRPVPIEVVSLLNQARDDGRLVPSADGLFDACPQTYAWASPALFVTSQKTDPAPARRRGRPRKTASDAERQALSRDRRARRDLDRLVLIAAMDAQLPPETRSSLEAEPRFRSLLEEARQTARLLAITNKL